MGAAKFPIIGGTNEKSNHQDSQGILATNASNELVFAVVGHVGSGTSEVAEALEDVLKGLKDKPFDTAIIKARDVIIEWATSNGLEVPQGADRSLHATWTLQDRGDDMRRRKTKEGNLDLPAVAKGLARKIAMIRASKTGQTYTEGEEVPTDGRRRAYILDSLRHPAEVQLLRKIYGDAFVLIGIACEEGKRRFRINEKYGVSTKLDQLEVARFMKRDEKDEESYGQRVADTFHQSDFFLDNTPDRHLPSGDPNPFWEVVENLGRLIRIITHSDIERPEVAETAMHHAYSAKMQSACLSRQVGAALIDSQGNVLATGTNEVPRGGGGVYGEVPGNGIYAELLQKQDSGSKLQPAPEGRCGLREGERFCSNTREQNAIIQEIIDTLPLKKETAGDERIALAKKLRKTKVGSLLEFSKAVHAEMDALLTAGRTGSSTTGARLFVTTFPCHYCARHIVSAGIDEVQYIEPYPKSQALDLHSDSIAVEVSDWIPPSIGGHRVLFRPFSGVAPSLYKKAFMKDRDLKDSSTGTFMISPPDWGNPWYLSRISYTELEAKLSSVE